MVGVLLILFPLMVHACSMGRTVLEVTCQTRGGMTTFTIDAQEYPTLARVRARLAAQCTTVWPTNATLLEDRLQAWLDRSGYGTPLHLTDHQQAVQNTQATYELGLLLSCSYTHLWSTDLWVLSESQTRPYCGMDIRGSGSCPRVQLSYGGLWWYLMAQPSWSGLPGIVIGSGVLIGSVWVAYHYRPRRPVMHGHTWGAQMRLTVVLAIGAVFLAGAVDLALWMLLSFAAAGIGLRWWARRQTRAQC
jgi:hypothetical protein